MQQHVSAMQADMEATQGNLQDAMLRNNSMPLQHMLDGHGDGVAGVEAGVGGVESTPQSSAFPGAMLRLENTTAWSVSVASPIHGHSHDAAMAAASAATAAGLCMDSPGGRGAYASPSLPLPPFMPGAGAGMGADPAAVSPGLEFATPRHWADMSLLFALANTGAPQQQLEQLGQLGQQQLGQLGTPGATSAYPGGMDQGSGPCTPAHPTLEVGGAAVEAPEGYEEGEEMVQTPGGGWQPISTYLSPSHPIKLQVKALQVGAGMGKGRCGAHEQHQGHENTTLNEEDRAV